jgi:hypothetical protein
VSTLLHGFVYDFTAFAECIGADCKKSGKLKKKICTSSLTIQTHFLVTQNHMQVRFEVSAEATMEITVFWDVSPCSLIDGYWHFGGTNLYLLTLCSHALDATFVAPFSTTNTQVTTFTKFTYLNIIVHSQQ